MEKTGDLPSMAKEEGRQCLSMHDLPGCDRVESDCYYLCACVSGVRVAVWPMPSDLYCLDQWEAQLHCLHCLGQCFHCVSPPPPLTHKQLTPATGHAPCPAPA